MGATSPVKIEARYYERTDDGYICHLCPHNCRIAIGKYGLCGTRRGNEDFLEAYSYGRVSSLCVDPIEKKPLNHYYPKSKIFSVGGIGCSMTCKHCQNYSISQRETGKKRTTYVSPQALVDMCRSEGMDSIAFTYNEPMIWLEYIEDVMRCDPDLRLVLVTNGFINEEPLKDLCKITDAMNIDIKAFRNEFSRDICHANLDDVLRTTKLVYGSGVHLEITYLLIPGYNDSMEELTDFSEWVVNELSSDVPVHFTRFHPDNGMDDVPWTPVETMIAAKEIAMNAGLEFVYLGNVMVEGGNDTICPQCDTEVIRRTGYMVDLENLDGNRCACCGAHLNIKN